MLYVTPSYSTGGSGMPVATRALPLDQGMMSAGMASMREVGLDSGRMIGRSTLADMASTTSRVNAPCTVDVPSRMVGPTLRTVSSSEMVPLGPAAQPETSSALRAYGFW